jgi:hypothetical protein
MGYLYHGRFILSGCRVLYEYVQVSASLIKDTYHATMMFAGGVPRQSSKNGTTGFRSCCMASRLKKKPPSSELLQVVVVAGVGYRKSQAHVEALI